MSRLDRFAILRRPWLLQLIEEVDAAALTRFPSLCRYARTMLVNA